MQFIISCPKSPQGHLSATSVPNSSSNHRKGERVAMEDNVGAAQKRVREYLLHIVLISLHPCMSPSNGKMCLPPLSERMQHVLLHILLLPTMPGVQSDAIDSIFAASAFTPGVHEKRGDKKHFIAHIARALSSDRIDTHLHVRKEYNANL